MASSSATPEPAKNREPDKDLTNAARRYLLALALLAENYPRSTGSYRLRSGCELLPVKKEVTILGSDNHSEHVNAITKLCGDRQSLVAVAKAAHEILKIPATLPLFESDAKGLKDYLERGGKTTNNSTAKQKPAAKKTK